MNTSIFEQLKNKYGERLTGKTPLVLIPKIISPLEWRYLKAELKYVNRKQENFESFVREHNKTDLCICGETNCTESYVHWTSGW